MTLVTPELVEQVRARLAVGKSYTQIGTALGLSKAQVAGVKRRHLGDVPLAATPPVDAPAPEPRGCRYPLSSGRPWVFCGAAVDRPGSPWCAAHRRICYAGRSWASAA